MSKEAIEFLGKINPSFKNMDINNTNTFGGEFLLYCIDKALNQGQTLPIDIVVRSAITYEQFQEALKIVNEYKTQLEEHYKIAKKEIEGISKFANVTKETKLYDTDLSVRCLNILRANDDKLGIDANWEMNVKELSKLSMSKFLQCRVAGKKTLQELKELCFYADVKLLP